MITINDDNILCTWPVCISQTRSYNQQIQKMISQFNFSEWLSTWVIYTDAEGTIRLNLILIPFMPLISFYTPWKHQKTRGFLIFPRGVERNHQWHETGYVSNKIWCTRAKFNQNSTEHGVIHLVRTQNFPKNKHFLPPDTQTYRCVSGGKKY